MVRPGLLSARAPCGVRWEGTPALFSMSDEQPGLLRIAGYVRACTEPGDRLFVLGVYPELYYFADGRLQGGTRGCCPCITAAPTTRRVIVARLKAARVPIVLTEDRATYDREYRTGVRAG